MCDHGTARTTDTVLLLWQHPERRVHANAIAEFFVRREGRFSSWTWDQRGLGATTPSSGLLAVAYSFFGILPAKYANRPASVGGAHGTRHTQGISCVSNPCIQQHTIHTQFHCPGHVAGRANTRVYDHGIMRVILFQVFQADANVVGG